MIRFIVVFLWIVSVFAIGYLLLAIAAG